MCVFASADRAARAWRRAPACDQASLPVTIGGAPEDADRLKRFGDLDAVRASVTLPAENAGQILPALDSWAKLIPQLR